MDRLAICVTALVIGLATACGGTAGKEFDTAHAHDVKEGQNKAQIQTWFGDAPQKTTFTKNTKGCVERWSYVYAHSQNGSTHSQALLVDFDEGGKVCDTAYSELDR